jgi:hypothetical protein
VTHLFIHLEDGARRFTLRKTARTGDGSSTSLHVDLLTSKLGTSLAKAYEYAKEMGLELQYDPARNIFPPDLDAIAQAKRDAKADKKSARQKIIDDRQAAFDKARQDRRAASELSLENGIYPFGKYNGERIDSQPGYANWMVEKKATFEKGSLLEYAVGVIERKYAHLLAKAESVYAPGHRPEKEKTRIQIKGTVIRSMSFSSDYGITYWIFIKDETGLCVVAKGGWWADEGTEVDVVATIKTKETYKGQDQTVVNRVK